MRQQYQNVSASARDGILKVNFKDFEIRRKKFSMNGELLSLASSAVVFHLTKDNLPEIVIVEMKNGEMKLFKYSGTNRANTPVYLTKAGDMIRFRNLEYATYN